MAPLRVQTVSAGPNQTRTKALALDVIRVGIVLMGLVHAFNANLDLPRTKLDKVLASNVSLVSSCSPIDLTAASAQMEATNL